MTTIWKYDLGVAMEQEIAMPEGSKILTVQMQKDRPRLWVAVNPALPKVMRRIFMLGTGYELPGLDKLPSISLAYVGTFQVGGGDLVFHIFDGGPTGERNAQTH